MTARVGLVDLAVEQATYNAEQAAREFERAQYFRESAARMVAFHALKMSCFRMAALHHDAAAVHYQRAMHWRDRAQALLRGGA